MATTVSSVSWFPDRKVLAGGLAGLVAWGLITVSTAYGYPPPIDQTVLAGVLAWLASYLTPPSAQDIINRLNDDIVKQAQLDPNVPVTKPRD